jgi:hypothetical protein
VFRQRRHLLAPAAVVAAFAVAFPLGVLAAISFSDVPPSHPFYNHIQAVAEAGVTTGCGGGKYCPDDNVTRGQMAAFMNRLGALGAGKTPVVNANTARSTDGWSIGCPSGTVLSGGLCFDTATRSSGNIFDASEACADLGGGILGRGQIWKLPQVLELRAAINNGDITTVAEEWSSTTWYSDVNSYRGMALNGIGMKEHTTIDVLPYRCAAIPLGKDLLIAPVSGPKDGSDPGKVDKSHDGKLNPDGSLK